MASLAPALYQIVLLLLLNLMSSCLQVQGSSRHTTASVLDVADANRNRHDSLALTSTSAKQAGYENNNVDSYDSSGQSQSIECASYDDNLSSGTSKKSTTAGFPNRQSKMCEKYCFTLWVTDQHNKSKITVSKQGCWQLPDSTECQFSNCISNQQPKKNNTFFCCCNRDMCNTNFQDIYNPAEHTTTTKQASPGAVVSGPLLDHSYRKKTIVIAMVSVISVALVTVFLYLAYRLCLTPKPTSPQSSSVARVETPLPPEFSVDDLKIEDLIVRGRYSEVRRGWLGDTEVAVKIYQPHHRQYYYNERNAFTQPFMDHENVVKFYGAKEQEDPETNIPQYFIVTKYIPLGSLMSYLKHNTIDWYQLCHMCQGVSRGLAHLHADIQNGDYCKPAIAHRDVNTRNILVNSDLTCMIADLGFSVGMIGSKIIKNGVAENAEQATLADVGTLRYMAPEVFDGAVNLRDCEASLKQIDVYALGLVIWEIASRCVDLYQGAPVPEYQLPFQAEAGAHPTFEEMQVLVVKYKTRPRFPEVWKDTNPAVRSLKETVEDCWDADAEARLTSLCVQERVTDMAALWAHGTKHRGVTPTLNATMNLPESSRNSGIQSGSAVVSNGVTYLPSFVDRNNEVNEDGGGGGLSQGEHFTAVCRRESDVGEFTYSEDVGLTTPLIGNVVQLGYIVGSATEEGRVRSWLHDQSVSGSTVDTLLPPTPSLEEDAPLFDEPNPGTHQMDPPILKASNVMIAKNKAVILHPNQGRNPTVERNTHKRSDEELTVSGNILVGPNNQVTTSEVDQGNRRGSLGSRSAPPNRNGDGGSFDGIEAVESSSLVQNDSLSHYHARTRNTPIPYFQNHVHGENVADYLTRPKLANISGNRSSYLPLHGESATPQTPNASFQTADKSEASSLMHKLSKLIRPKDFGIKFSHMMFGGQHKKSQKLHVDVESMASRNEDTGRASGQYINSGLDASPINNNITNVSPSTPGTVAMEVQMVNGSFLTRACSVLKTPNYLSHQNGNMIVEPQIRLSATNVMRLGVVANLNHEELPSPSLFQKPGSNSGVNDTGQMNTVSAQHIGAPKAATDSVRPVILNQAYGLDSSGEMSYTDCALPGLLVSDGIPGEAATCDHHLCNQHRNSNNLTSVNLNNSYSIMPTAASGHTSVTSCSENFHQASAVGAAEPTLASVCDSGILNTVVQSPQNKTVCSINKHPPVTENSPIVKACSQHVSQAPTVYIGPLNHHSDTKGGNSVMHSIRMDSNSKDLLKHSNSKKSTQLQVKKLSPKSHSDTARVSQSKGSNLAECASVHPHKGLSQSHSVTDLENDPHKVNGHRYNGGDADNFKRSKTDQIWQGLNMSTSCTFSTKARPRSLNLKGHNYDRGRGRSASSSSLSSSCQTSESFSHTTLQTKDKNGPLAVAVPNITLGKNSTPAANLNFTDKKAPVIPTAGAVNTGNADIKTSCNITEKHRTVNHIKTSEDGSGDDVSVSRNISKICANLNEQSDSSEKIRKRIKTPVSFKKNRLSLYDDRLMTQSLGFVSLSDVGGITATGGCEDKNNNDGNIGMCSHGTHEFASGTTAQMNRADYYKMIKSESDLVV